MTVNVTRRYCNFALYNKIFTKILDSSIWLETDTTRIVWLTLIATMDEDGFCQFASVGNLAHRAVVPLDKATSAVKILESADLNSSDPDNEGRRIERVPGGWMVLNAVKYREIVTRSMAQEKTRNRVREKREREKSGYDAILKAQGHLCACCSVKFEAPYSLNMVLDRDRLICQPCKANGGVTAANGGVTAANGGVTQSEAYTEAYTETKGKQLPKTPPSATSQIAESKMIRYVMDRDAERKAQFTGAALHKALHDDMRTAAFRERIPLSKAKVIFKQHLEYATLPWIDSLDSQQEIKFPDTMRTAKEPELSATVKTKAMAKARQVIELREAKKNSDHLYRDLGRILGSMNVNYLEEFIAEAAKQ